MTTLAFPDTTGKPTDGSFTYEANGVLYSWTGDYWAANNAQGFDQRYVNADGDTMTGDLTVPSLNGGPLSGLRNQLINGDFRIWQRGNDVTTSQNVPSYTADRWSVRMTGSANQSSHKTGSANSTLSTLPSGFSSGWETNYNAADGGTFKLAQGVELESTGEPGPFIQGSQWTFSVWANFNLTAEADPELMFRDAVGYSTSADNVTALTSGWLSTGETSNSWTRYKITGTITAAPKASATCLTAFIYFASGPNSSGASRRALTGCQLEPGPVATPFEHRPISLELSLCQRYFYKFSGALYASTYARNDSSGDYRVVNFSFHSTMRETPTMNNVTFSGGGSNLQIQASPSAITVIQSPKAVSSSTALRKFEADAEL